MEAYLDNAATTRPFDSVREIMLKTMELDFGNPSSMHKKGMEAEQYVKDAREKIAKTLKVEPKELIFTSGGTESNNMALIGASIANKRQGNHIITTKIEHPSVHEPILFLEEMGFRITFLDVDEEGHIDTKQLINSICEDTILVSIMMVNNEIGAVEDVSTISKLIKEKKDDILIHVDAIQAYGKYRIYPKRMGIDMLSISGHKIHGPKGIGVLYVRDKVKIKPIIYGGGQQKGMRSGTENVPGIAGLGVAAEEIYRNHEEKIQHLYELKKALIDGVSKLTDTFVNGVGEDLYKTAPHVVSVSFMGVRSEVLLHALEDRGVYVSSGSACSSNHPALSGTLQAIKVKKELLDSTLRFSFSIFTTMDEINYALDQLTELLPMLRRFTRR